MDRVVDLHGGPWHGRRVTIPPDRDHIHIIGLFQHPRDYVAQDADAPIEAVAQREGIYSQVRNTSNFEWDGWITHE